MTLTAYTLAGITGVGNMILWGLYGDFLAEPFRISKIFRSLTLAVVFSFLIYGIKPDLPLLAVALNIITLERIVTEIYKALIRKENQKKYHIPSDLGLKISRGVKRPAGMVLIILVLSAYFSLFKTDLNIGQNWFIALAGLTVALGGMMKDAPYEGFDGLKFLRSPLVALLAGFLIKNIYPDLNGIAFFASVTGGERIMSEFYKKILKSRVPGKFRKDLSINREWLHHRKFLLIPYFLTIAVLISLI